MGRILVLGNPMNLIAKYTARKGGTQREALGSALRVYVAQFPKMCVR